MRRILAVLLVLVLIVATPANASHQSPTNYVTATEYNTVQYNWEKMYVHAVFGQTGHRTLEWSDRRGNWIEKEYLGNPIPYPTKVKADYLWTGKHWHLKYKTWCVQTGYGAWNCNPYQRN